MMIPTRWAAVAVPAVAVHPGLVVQAARQAVRVTHQAVKAVHLKAALPVERALLEVQPEAQAVRAAACPVEELQAVQAAGLLLEKILKPPSAT